MNLYIDYEPHDEQKKLHNSDKRYKVAVCGRRGGKTVAALAELQRQWYKRSVLTKTPGEYWYIAPQVAQAKRIIWSQKMIFKFFPPAIVKKVSESEGIIMLRDGSRIQIIGVDSERDVGKTKGSGVFFAILDEFDQLPMSVWYDGVQPALRDNRGGALFIGTADEGFANLYGLYMGCLTDDKMKMEWDAFSWSIFDNPHIPEEEKIQIKRDYADGRISEATWLVQYLGKFAIHSGAVYKEFSLDTHVFGDYGIIPKGSRNFMAMDYGYNDPFACLWGAVDHNNVLYIYREHYISGQPGSWHAEKIQEKNGMERMHGVFMDPSAKGIMEEFKKYNSKLYGGIRSPFSDKDSESKRIITGINRIKKRLLKDRVLNSPTLLIHESCTNLIKEFQMYHWKSQDSNDTDTPDDNNNHALDALRYMEAGIFVPTVKKQNTQSKISLKSSL